MDCGTRHAVPAWKWNCESARRCIGLTLDSSRELQQNASHSRRKTASLTAPLYMWNTYRFRSKTVGSFNVNTISRRQQEFHPRPTQRTSTTSLVQLLWSIYCCMALTSSIFVVRPHTDVRYWYSNSVRPSVRHVPVSDENGFTYCHIFSPYGSPIIRFTSIKHIREIPTGWPPAGALNTGGVYQL